MKILSMCLACALAVFAQALPPALDPVPVDRAFWKTRHAAKLDEIKTLGGEVDLVFIGDSLTHIWETRCPDILTEIRRDFSLLNLGYSGDRTANVLWRIGAGGELDGYRAKCIMLEIGTNNSSREPTDETVAAIRKILDTIAAKQPQAKTILLPVFPRRDGGSDKPLPRPHHAVLNAELRKLADGTKVVWRDFNDKFLDNADDTLWIMPDRLHPEGPGLRMWYDSVKDLFREICGKQPPRVTDGWENVCSNRWHLPVTNPVWRADLSDPAAFTLEKHDGAEGKLEVTPTGLAIRKTNAKGFIVVRTRPFAASTNAFMLFSADLAVREATPARSHAFLRGERANGTFAVQNDAMAAARTFGWPEATDLINTAPGMTYRKYGCFRSENGQVTPAIIVAGEPSVSEWRTWAAQDNAAARDFWKKNVRDLEKSPKRLKPELVPDELFDRMIAADVQHTAKIERFGGVTRMLIDGRAEIPTIYEGMRHLPDYTEINDARGLVKAGVRAVAPIVLGAGDKSKKYSICWTPAGYDAKKAVDHFRETMRASGNALMMVCYDCNTYPEFVTKEHPDEGWLDQDGNPIVGTYGSSVVGYQGMTKDKAWPWVSMASRSWREAVCSNIRAFVAELKRRGLDKRVIGVHFTGYNDGQFGMVHPDYSKPAQEEYRRYLAECGDRSTNYWHFCRQLGARAVEEFGRTFKKAMGKDVIVLRRCDSPFVVDFGFGANNRSDAIDVTVTGPTYDYRYPAISCSTFVPFSSMPVNGKMLWNEFDLRTWWIRQSSNPVGDRRSGPYDDIEAWRAGYRKLAGEMIANRGGFWFYDMGRGWFSAPGVPEDVADSFRTFRSVIEKKPSQWQPDAAIVVDEEGFFGWDGGERPYPGHTYEIVERQMLLLGNAGVPYSYYLAEDVLRNPKLLEGRKAVFFLLWRKFDEKRTALVKRLMKSVPTLVFMAESGTLSAADEEATGFQIDFSWDPKSFRVVPEKMMKASVTGVMDIEQITCRPFGQDRDNPIAPATGRRGAVVEKTGVVPLGRFSDDGSVAIAMRRDGNCRRIYIAAPGGLSPEFFSRIVSKAGGYVPVPPSVLQVNMNGDFISVHALKEGCFDFVLPFPCRVTNAKTGKYEMVLDGKLPLRMTAGETCWFLLEP